MDKNKDSEELIIANRALAFQNKEIERRETELIKANKELVFQNNDKVKKANELTVSVSKHLEAEAKLNKMNRLYAFISGINKTITHVRDEQKLFKEACRIAYEQGEFKIAWIGKFDIDKKEINLLEQFGINPSNLSRFENALFEKDGPQDYVLKHDKSFICNDIERELKVVEWKDFVSSYQVRSCAVLPLKKEGVIIGTFNLYSTELNFFDTAEIKMLEEVAEDINFGLSLFEKEDKQRQTELLIEKSEKLFRALIENSTNMKTLTTKEGKVLYASPSIMKYLGYTLDEFFHLYPDNLIHPDDLPDYLEGRRAMLYKPGSSFNFRQRRRNKNGNWIWCKGTIVNKLDDPAIEALVSNFDDINDYKKTEDQREFDANNLDALINNTTDLMWSVDTDFNLITSNKPFDKMVMVNFNKTLAKGENVLSVAYTPEMREHFKERYECAFAGETVTKTEYFDHPVELWTEISYSPIFKGDKVIGTACHSRDITNLKRAEKQLTKSEARLKEAQDIAHIANWEIDLVNNIHIWSDEFYEIYGIARNEIQPSAEAFLSFMHPKDSEYAHRKVSEAFETFKSSNINFRFIAKDNSIKYGYSEWRFEFDANSKPIRLFGILQDVTEQKRAELLIAESEARLAEAQAVAKVGSWKTNLLTFEVLLSAETLRIFEVSSKTFRSSYTAFLEFIHPEDKSKVDAAFLASLDNNTINSIEHRIITGEGNIKIVEERWKISRDKMGVPEWAIGTCQDITERKNAEEEREKMVAHMIQRNRDLEQFTFIVSHNLRAPTANIIGFTETLQDETITQEDQKVYLNELSISVSNLDTVIKDINKILQLKQEADGNKGIIHFSELVNGIVVSVKNLIDKHQIQIQTDFSAIDEIFSLKVYMHSIFYNLISNSIKYRRPDVQCLIEIKSRKEKGKIILSFKDNGYGIDLESKGDKIFGLYKRFHSHVEGKGMGLFMVKTQVESLGGKITVDSELNKGTVFTITLEV